MRKLLALIAGVALFTSCEKLEELTPQQTNIEPPTQVHVYYDSAQYYVDTNMGQMYDEGGDTTKQGVKVYTVKDELTYFAFAKTAGKRVSVTFLINGKKMELGYVDRVDPGVFANILRGLK